MFNRNSLVGFGLITRRIKGRFTAPQPGNPHIASGGIVYLTHPPHRSLTVSSLSGSAFRPIGMHATKVFKDPLVPPSLPTESLRGGQDNK